MASLQQIREISALSFNERVLQEAEDRRNPPMERLRFLGIFSSNMDEFFKVRVASIQRRHEMGKKGMMDILEAVNHKSRELDERFQAAYADILTALALEGIKIVNEKDVAHQPRAVGDWLEDYFKQNILPLLVPIILNKRQPFPQLKDSALYFGVKMWGEKLRYAILEIPDELPRFVELPNGNMMYLDDVIRYSLNDVFYIFEYERIGAYEFKISRDAELDIDNDFSEGYVRKMERVLRQREGGRPTRFVYDASIPPGMRELLLQSLHLDKDDTLIGGGRYHNMKDLMNFPSHRPDLSFEKKEPARHPVLDRERTPIMDIIEKQDVLVTYPYQSFDHVIRLLREAAIDPKVTDIRMTLYRSAGRSQVVNTLVNAAKNGKKVTVSVELQARFDEENNISISQRLSEVGVNVTYGVPPMKVHSKLLMIKRRNKVIAGLSTGNFHEGTGRLYVDSILLTADKRVTVDVEKVFTYLEEAAKTRTLVQPNFKQLLVSPFNTRKTFTKLLNRETKKGEDGYVFLKTNHLTDEAIIKRIRAAADAGVKMDLVVRTTYAMLPHENIRAISILDRYLEHQRVYIFGRDEDQRMYLSSADLMERNIDWRIEVAFPIYDPSLQQVITDTMAMQVADTFKARILDEQQSNQYVGESANGRRSQEEIHRYFRDLYAIPGNGQSTLRFDESEEAEVESATQ